jgi:hypothetical protein
MPTRVGWWRAGLGLSTNDALANVREFRRDIRLLPEKRRASGAH